MNKMDPFYIPIGKDKRPYLQVFQARTPEQFVALREIVNRNEFNYAVTVPGNIFSKDVGNYKKGFHFAYYTKNQQLIGIWITAKGRIKEVRV